jgi:lipopolysaccharide transport system ATP-binding protein
MAGSQHLLNVDGASKKFARRLRTSLRYGYSDICRELTGRSRNSSALRSGEFWALKDVGFDLEAGKALGLIGVNGSGKTTLLRLISGLIRLDEGTIRYRGKMAPLIALGAGFSPVLTGRENIYVNMAILGMTKKEIDTRFDDVVAFAELEDAIDSPVRTYSSGMAARLGFASAIHTRPDILLVDEVLSVGDMRFRAKCYRRLAELKADGVTFVLVSHAINSILSLSDSVLYLSGGRCKQYGAPAEVVARYERDMVDPGEETGTRRVVLPEKPASKSVGVDIMELAISKPDLTPAETLTTGEGGCISISYWARKQADNVGVIMLIRELSHEMELVLNLNSERDGVLFSLRPGRGSIQLHFPSCALRPGAYTAKVFLVSGDHYVFDAVESFRFRVESRAAFVQSRFHQDRGWHLMVEKSEAEARSSF